jgi:hypothetical protein
LIRQLEVAGKSYVGPKFVCERFVDPAEVLGFVLNGVLEDLVGDPGLVRNLKLERVAWEENSQNRLALRRQSGTLIGRRRGAWWTCRVCKAIDSTSGAAGPLLMFRDQPNPVTICMGSTASHIRSISVCIGSISSYIRSTAG